MNLAAARSTGTDARPEVVWPTDCRCLGSVVGLASLTSFLQNALFFALLGVRLALIGAQNAHNSRPIKKLCHLFSGTS
jgi:hypothetical protein